MTDYKLEGLSPRTFEHLVQALAVTAITPTLTPFGDGPDGGREATFNGPCKYDVKQAPWDGHGVIQAKFLQRPRDPGLDGKWLGRELRKELNNLQKRVRGGARAPQYYILATNVTLTATERTGGKDRIISQLEGLKGSIDLLDFDIWDYDKIRILLDNNADVRKSYSAWITPGDVLAELAGSLRSRRKSFYRLATNFMQKEFLADQFAKLEQAGHSADEAIPLAQVFVDLPTSFGPPTENEIEQRSSDERFVASMVRVASDRFTVQPSAEGEDNKTRVRVTRQPGRYVLIGGPGQGKTTVGQFVCQVFRAAILADVDNSLLDAQVKIAMNRITEQLDSGIVPRPNARRIPFRIVLSEFATSLAEQTITGVIEYLALLFSKRTSTVFTAEEFQQLLVEYPSVLVLDGLDEVPASTNRQQVLDAIRDFSVDVTSSAIDVLVIATSRPQGYEADFSPQLYEHRWLVPLSPSIALEYGRKLTNVRFGSDSARVAKVQSRLERAVHSPSTARLMRTPLQVTILTLLVDRMGQPPQERWALFHEYYNLIYQRETERDIEAAEVLKQYRPDIDAIHKRVGLLLQLESERSGRTDARLTTDQFSKVVDQYLFEEGHIGDDRASLKAQIIEGAANRLVFLVGLDLGEVGFELRSLQEFMAAEGVMDADDSTTQNRLREIAANRNWRNVFLFAAGKCFTERRYLRDTIESICLGLNDDPEDEISKRTLAGSELALELLEEGSATRQPAKFRALTRVALRLIEVPGEEWHRRLAGVWQSSSDDIFYEMLKSSVLAGSPAERYAAWACLIGLLEIADEKYALLARESLARYRFDEELCQLFLLMISDGVPVPPWLTRGLFDALPTLSVTVLIRAMQTSRLSKRIRDDLSYAENVPEWLSAVWLQFEKGYWGRAVPIKVVAKDGSRLLGRSVIALCGPESDEESAEAIEILKAIPQSRSDWRAFRSAMLYRLTPTKAKLLDCLTSLEGLDKNVIDVLSHIVAWPLQNCLRAISASEVSPAHLAVMCSNGDLGDRPEWISIERSWMQRGVPIEYLVDKDTLKAGINNSVVVMRSLRVGVSYVEGSDRRNLLQVYRNTEHAPARRLLADAICRTWLRGWRTASPDELASLDEVLRDCFVSSWYSALQFLSQLPPAVPLAGRWHEGLECTSINILRSEVDIRAKDLYGRTVQQWSKTPGKPGLVIALAICALAYDTAGEHFPDVRTAAIGDDHENVMAAQTIVSLRAGVPPEWMLENVRSGLRIPGLLFSFIRAIQSGLSSDTDKAKLTIKLCDLAVEERVDPGEIFRAMMLVVSARRSRLSASEVWRQLRFPEGLMSVLQG